MILFQHTAPCTHLYAFEMNAATSRKKMLIFLFAVRAENKCELIKRCCRNVLHCLCLFINKFSTLLIILFHFLYVCISFVGLNVWMVSLSVKIFYCWVYHWPWAKGANMKNMQSGTVYCWEKWTSSWIYPQIATANLIQHEKRQSCSETKLYKKIYFLINVLNRAHHT